MTSQFNIDGELARFSERAPLFPLPNIVFFPHTLLPLHIFEPRFRKMVADVIVSERLVAMARLKPGWENIYEEKTAAIFNTVCVGRIEVQERLPDERYNLILRGVGRAEILEEKQVDLPYRVAKLKLLEDHYPQHPVIDRNHRQRELLTAFYELYPVVNLGHVVHESLDTEIPLGQLCDVLAHSMKLETSAQEILDEVNVDLRSDLLLQRLRKQAANKKGSRATESFPPRFSLN